MRSLAILVILATALAGDVSAKKVAPKPVTTAPAPPAPSKPPPPAPSDPYAITAVPRVSISDIPAVQGLLGVQRLGGWLLTDHGGDNPIAKSLVAPSGSPTHLWFYLIPAKGEPRRLVNASEASSFKHLPGTEVTYAGHVDMEKKLKAFLKGAKTVALEYSPKAAIPALSRVDAGTLELIKASGVKVRSSDTLVQFTKAVWGDAGRTAHHVAAHHLGELRREALEWLAKQLAARVRVSEYDVQQRLVKGMTTRGLTGPAPTVAAGVNTADPTYVPTAETTSLIKRGDLVVIGLAGKSAKGEGIYAAHTWVAVADTAASTDQTALFALAKSAREQVIALIDSRAQAARPITGAEVDRTVRAFFTKSGAAAKIAIRTGHSLDTELFGSGTDLDDFDVKDTRILTAGTGFTVGPGLYTAGAFGLRTEVSCYLGPNGLEVTTPSQDAIQTLLTR